MKAWELTEGLEIIRRINPLILEVGHALGITGSVLFAGESDNDLDLIVYPLKSVNTPYGLVFDVFERQFPGCQIAAVDKDRTLDQKSVFTIKLADKRRIELFFPAVPISNRHDTIKSCSEKHTY